MANEHRRWLDMSLEARFAALHSPRPVAAPAAAAVSLVSTMRNVTFAPGDAEQWDRDKRKADALAAILRAEREQAEAAERERAEFRNHVVHDTAVGRLFSGGG